MAKKTKNPAASSKAAKSETAADKKKAAAVSASAKDKVKKAKTADKTKTDKTGKKKTGSRIKQYFKDLHAEMKKIIWTNGKDTMKNTLVVLLVVVVVGIGVWISDALLVKLREVIYNYSVKDAETAFIALRAMIGML